MQIKNPQVTVGINRDKAAALNVDPRTLEDALYSAYGARQISTIYAPNNQYKVIMELEPQYALDPSALGMLYVHSKTGQLVPMSALASFKKEVGPLTVTHLGQLPAVTVSFNLKPNVALGDAITAVNNEAAKSTLHHQHQPARHGAGISIVVRRAGRAAHDGHPGHLYRAGSSL